MSDDHLSFTPLSLLQQIRQSPLRLLLFSLCWLILSGADMASWILGVPAVLSATIISILLAPSSLLRFSFIGLLRFIPFFLRQSVVGGVDVMRRALSLRQLLDPGLVSYTTLLPDGSARIFFINCISLLPGTLSARLHGDIVTIHTLDLGLPVRAAIRKLEYHVAALMAVSLEEGRRP